MGNGRRNYQRNFDYARREDVEVIEKLLDC
jgi:hypothetical protein